MPVLSILATLLPAARRGARTAALLSLAVAAPALAPQAARAQATPSLTTFAVFNGANGSTPNQTLTFGADGYLYGVAPAGGANELGTFYRVNSDGSITLLYRFGDFGGTLSPASPLLLGTDGSFYGMGARFGSIIPTAVYRITTSGSYTILHTFSTNDGTNPVPGLVQGTDGALYGVMQTGGNQTIANPAGDGTVFRLTTDGSSFSTFYSFNFNRQSFGGSGPSVPLTRGRDGYFYGVTSSGGNYGVGSIYRLSPNGVASVIHSFDGQEGSNPAGALVEDSFGTFYGITTDGASGYGTFFSVTSTGTFSVLHTFTADESGASTGTTKTTVAPSGLVRAADGTFYLTLPKSGAASDRILQLTTAGAVTTVLQLAPNAPVDTILGALASAPDGSLYGTTATGGPSGDGTVFQFVTLPHPPFFNSMADLSNGVEYLAFPNGNYFGYYSFLSDPHYIYHFDLGFEYVFDAADSVSGVYLYDFASKHFFYTSPTFPFPYLYDFTLDTVLYYYPDPRRPGRYNTNEVRYFYDFAEERIVHF